MGDGWGDVRKVNINAGGYWTKQLARLPLSAHGRSHAVRRVHDHVYAATGASAELVTIELEGSRAPPAGSRNNHIIAE